MGAIALFSAHAFDRTNPGLATLLRCGAGGIGLIWLFNRFWGTTTDSSLHAHSSPHAHYVHHVHHADDETSRHVAHGAYGPYGFGSPPHVIKVPTYHAPVVPFPKEPPHYTRHAHTTYSASDYSGVPLGFPTVHRAAAQPDMKPMYPAPVTDHVDGIGHKPSKHAAHTTYSASDHSGVPVGFPTVHCVHLLVRI